MSIVTFGFYSTAGEDLARLIVSGICADVDADLVTRRKALDRLADALERVSDLDGGASDPDPIGAIADHVSLSFVKAGYEPISGEALVAHSNAWRRTGAPVSDAAVPPSVEVSAAAAREVSTAAAALAARSEVSVAISAHAPWTEEFRAGEAAAAEVVLFLHADDPDSVVEANPFLGCVILGPESSSYLDWAMSPAIPGDSEDRLRALLCRDGPDYAALAVDLGRLERAASSLNLAARMVNQPRRLSLSLTVGPSGVPVVACAWDGIEVSHSIPAAAPEASSSVAQRSGRRGTVDAEALSEDLFTGAEAAPGDAGANAEDAEEDRTAEAVHASGMSAH